MSGIEAHVRPDPRGRFNNSIVEGRVRIFLKFLKAADFLRDSYRVPESITQPGTYPRIVR